MGVVVRLGVPGLLDNHNIVGGVFISGDLKKVKGHPRSIESKPVLPE